MAKIKYVEHGGGTTEVEVPAGWSVMEGAVKNNVPGIEAECGGACSCATCHVYVATAWLDKLPVPSDTEDAMLEFARDRRANSRLSCQIPVTAELDGLSVETPKVSCESAAEQ